MLPKTPSPYLAVGSHLGSLMVPPSWCAVLSAGVDTTKTSIESTGGGGGIETGTHHTEKNTKKNTLSSYPHWSSSGMCVVAVVCGTRVTNLDPPESDVRCELEIGQNDQRRLVKLQKRGGGGGRYCALALASSSSLVWDSLGIW